jgi:hypothetical protein
MSTKGDVGRQCYRLGGQDLQIRPSADGCFQRRSSGALSIGIFCRAGLDPWRSSEKSADVVLERRGSAPLTEGPANLFETVKYRFVKAVKVAARVLAGIIVTGISIWAVGALYYSPIFGQEWRAIAAGSYAAIVIISMLFLARSRGAFLLPVIAFALMLVLFFRVRASNDREWQADVSVTPYATVNGDLITIHGVRNFGYRTEMDFTPNWETRTYDLRKLDSVDLIAVYWAGKAIVHTMLSFGFEGKDYVAVSIETRKEKGESYSTLAGFFRQYELYYVVADERDVVRVRTTYRQPQEDVYVYRVNAPLVNIRRGFLDYVKTMNDLREGPSYYNTLATNCTTSVLFHTRMNPESPPLSWKVLLSGYVPDYLYELGRLDQTRPFAELERLSLVNARAHAADRDSAFSQRIREGLPKPAAQP